MALFVGPDSSAGWPPQVSWVKGPTVLDAPELMACFACHALDAALVAFCLGSERMGHGVVLHFNGEVFRRKPI